MLFVLLAQFGVVLLVLLVGIVAALRFLAFALLLFVVAALLLAARVHIRPSWVLRRTFRLALDALALPLFRGGLGATLLVGQFHHAENGRALQFGCLKFDDTSLQGCLRLVLLDRCRLLGLGLLLFLFLLGLLLLLGFLFLLLFRLFVGFLLVLFLVLARFRLKVDLADNVQRNARGILLLLFRLSLFGCRLLLWRFFLHLYHRFWFRLRFGRGLGRLLHWRRNGIRADDDFLVVLFLRNLL